MAGRLVLVIGSQSGETELTMLRGAALELAEVFTHPDLGSCQPALPGGATVLDPTYRELDAALRAAFERAHDERATLIIAFIGHGDFADDDYYLKVTDSSGPDSQDSLLVGQRIKELLRQYSDLDGLLVLIDACHAAAGLAAAGREWLKPAYRKYTRLEVLTAADEGSAYKACMSRSLAQFARTGHRAAGEYLRAEDLRPGLLDTCKYQVSQHLSFNGTDLVTASDRGLWLLRNRGGRWAGSPLAGGAYVPVAEGLLEQFIERPVAAELAGAVAGSARCVLLHGPAGSGKSALLAGVLREQPMHAGLLLTSDEPPEFIAGELRRQLTTSLPGFADALAAYWDTVPEQASRQADALELHVLGPLRQRTRAGEVRIVLDFPAEQDHLWQLVTRLLAEDAVRVITAARAPLADLPASAIEVPAATDEEIDQLVRLYPVPDFRVPQVVELARNNWTAARMFAKAMAITSASAEGAWLPRELTDAFAEQLRRAKIKTSGPVGEEGRQVLALLAAAGAGPVLPITVLAAAAGLAASRVRVVLARLDPLLVRAHPGEENELVGLGLSALIGYLADGSVLEIDPAEQHARLAKALTTAERGTPEWEYALAAEARHHWLSGEHTAALDSLDRREAQLPVEQRKRWSALAELLSARFGADHPLSLRAEGRVATWTAKAGDPDSALRAFGHLLDRARDPEEALNLRENIAYWTCEGGDPEHAKEQYDQLLTDCRSLLGPEHPQTLMTQHNRAVAISKSGDDTVALEQFRAVLPLRERVLGPLHIDTLRTRNNILYRESAPPYPPPVMQRWSALVADHINTFGEDHPDTLTVRCFAAMFLAKSGEVERALELLLEMRPATERVFGRWHPQLRKVDEQYDFWLRFGT